MKIKLQLAIWVFVCFSNFTSNAQNIQVDDTISFNKSIKPELINAQVLNLFFDKLLNLERTKQGKLRIVQIGDSHLQADFSTNIIKDIFQNKFGNGGLGFIFPHKLANTNGTRNVIFKSNTTFASSRNIRPADENPIGISGYTITSANKDAIIEVKFKNEGDFPNTIKILTPSNSKTFDLAFSNNSVVSLENKSAKTKSHKVKKGETLFNIAKKYGVSTDFIKKQNNLKSDKLAIGKSLKVGEGQVEKSTIDFSELDKVNLLNDGKSYVFNSNKNIDKFYLITDSLAPNFKLSGLLFENNNSGITFSGIGVNGAKYSDYNRFQLFFEQLEILQPNLLIVSLGTNESFDRLDVSEYIANLKTFVSNVKETNPETTILITTPPPSTLHKKFKNTFIADYSKAIIEFSNTEKTFAVFDLYQILGAENGVNQNKQRGFLAKDEVHYTKEGYEKQGNLLAEVLLNTYQKYISNK